MRARIVAKSSAARGRVMFPPVRLVEFWWRFRGKAAARWDRKAVNSPGQVPAPARHVSRPTAYCATSRQRGAAERQRQRWMTTASPPDSAPKADATKSTSFHERLKSANGPPGPGLLNQPMSLLPPPSAPSLTTDYPTRPSGLANLGRDNQRLRSQEPRRSSRELLTPNRGCY